MSKFAGGYFPRTACSFGNLDQAVASTAGMAVFAFSTYDAVRAYYATYYSQSAERREEVR